MRKVFLKKTDYDYVIFYILLEMFIQLVLLKIYETKYILISQEIMNYLF